ncbi:Ammonium transporter family and Ammonium transporter AmtB-like domain-containing protein [Strongyloides ratti]|uniref:Ammonium transporter n=1 Tax=Strongyloides ratti TaxID=34506 RepID=A0A090KWU5_STRRB|nr:Ammonium transporter family and Ammonium transporter AmtB-like domain-containing protein [Strongyloides ratti]CEF60342.1 Ammonium transporter family and Ammonium transporter AmtB-like domain-containing protein [Strongyloides ratti]
MEPAYAFPEWTKNKYYGENDTKAFQDDGVWLLSCSFTIFTMTSGFGLLESGRVSSKDEVNIMVKNVIDVVFGGLSYWSFGFGFTFGDLWPNPIIGLGKFFYDPEDDYEPSHQAWSYATFFFQMSFATTTSTIVSASMAERIRLRPYIIVTFFMTIIHSISAHWVWSEHGFLKKLGVVDAAGCSVVHLAGGVAGLVSTIYLKPRVGRFGEKGGHSMSNPTNALLGTFMLWWGWLGFNTGSAYGIANGRWRLAARSAMVTILSSIGGGCTALVVSLLTTKKCKVDLLIDGLLASLVSTTASCLCVRPMQSLLIGSIGSGLAVFSYPLIEKFEIDDPVGVIPVHVIGSTWGMLCVGIFGQNDKYVPTNTNGQSGLLYNGGIKLLAIQSLAIIVIFIWAGSATLIILIILDHTRLGVRLSKYEEQLGADLVEHGLAGHNIAKYSVEKKLSAKMVTILVSVFVRWKRLVKKRRLQRNENKQNELSIDIYNDNEKYNNGALPTMLNLTNTMSPNYDNNNLGNLSQNTTLNDNEHRINEDGKIKNKYSTNTSALRHRENVDMESQKKHNEFFSNIITKNSNNLNQLCANKVFPANTVYLNPSSSKRDMLDDKTEIFELKIHSKKS